EPGAAAAVNWVVPKPESVSEQAPSPIPQLIAPPSPRTTPGPETVSWNPPAWTNATETTGTCAGVTPQTAPVPTQPAVQPLKVYPCAATAVRKTSWCGNSSVLHPVIEHGEFPSL